MLPARHDITEALSIEGPGRDRLTLLVPTTGAYDTFWVEDQGSTTAFTFSVEKLTGQTQDAMSISRRQFFANGENLFLREVDLIGNGRTLSNRSGAAVVVQNADLTLQDCRIENHRARHRGGAVFISNTSARRVLIERCVFRDNKVTGTNGNDGFPKDGGAIFARDQSSLAPGTKLEIFDSEFSDNEALIGGAIVIRDMVALSISNSTLSGNVGISSGGAIHIIKNVNAGAYNPPIYLEATTITNNLAGLGGGLTISNNVERSLLLANTVIAGNTATYENPSRPNANPWHEIFKAGEIVASHSLIGDDLDDVRGLQITEHASAIGTVIFERDPMLRPLADNGGHGRTHGLLSGSPLIDAGASNASPRDQQLPFPATDQRGSGFARVKGANIDIGAFESSPPGSGGGGGGGGGGAVGLLTLLLGIGAAIRRRKANHR